MLLETCYTLYLFHSNGLSDPRLYDDETRRRDEFDFHRQGHSIGTPEREDKNTETAMSVRPASETRPDSALDDHTQR